MSPIIVGLTFALAIGAFVLAVAAHLRIDALKIREDAGKVSGAKDGGK